MPLEPCKELEHTIHFIDTVFRENRIPYWLSFGGLWSIVKNDGVIPDGDIDIGTYYGSNGWNKIVRFFTGHGYKLSKAILNDIARDTILYCGFNKEGYPHICVSFWYLHDGIRYYCHDTHFELQQGEMGVPKSGYYFKGVPDWYVSNESMLKRVEWPGIDSRYKISVPIMPGIMDYMYPAWGYIKQLYVVRGNEIQKDKCKSIHQGGAISPYMIHLNSMKQFDDEKYIKTQIEEGKIKWENRLKEVQRL